MKKINYNELIAIHKILQTVVDKNFPIVLGHKIQKNFKRINDAMQEFEQLRLKLIDKYAYKDENEKPVIINNRFDLKDKQAFDEEYNDLLASEIELTVDTISFTALEKMEESGRYDNLTPREQAALEFMIEEEE